MAPELVPKPVTHEESVTDVVGWFKRVGALPRGFVMT